MSEGRLWVSVRARCRVAAGAVWRVGFWTVLLAATSWGLAVAGCATPGGSAAGLGRGEGSGARRAFARKMAEGRKWVRAHYEKHEYRIPMRDGVRLHTAVYVPRDTSKRYPFLMLRTPYSCRPYGEDEYPSRLLPGRHLSEKGYIFVYQDVRGRFMSEGDFVNMRPHIDEKRSSSDVDESSDTYDTIDWLVKNVPNNNGRVGMWGISYPGFYAAAGMIDAHPALKAVSPQAPISDWFFDDFHHHGAFFLTDAFNFFSVFGKARKELTTEWGERFRHGTPDGYRFFLDLGPLPNVNKKYYKGEIAFWNAAAAHPNYDAFWQSRNILPHLHGTAPASMIVGGWFDAEDLYGPLNIYRAVEAANPGVNNVLVMGPWVHGGWNRTKGDRLGDISFGGETSKEYRERMEVPFFEYHLKGIGSVDLAEANVFETGRNRWRRFDRWPPDGQEQALYLTAGSLSDSAPEGSAGDSYTEYVSDPAKPVPSCVDISVRTPKHYMVADQRYAARRPDVATFRGAVLDEPVTMAGRIKADLWVSTSGTASDWVVKIIDEFPPDAEGGDDLPRGVRMGGYQMMVRSEVLRGRYRESYEHPNPFVPDEPTRVRVVLQDVLHTFLPGHRIVVQVQSSWFPLVDRNPQKYVDNIFEASEADFIKSTQRVYHSADHASRIEFVSVALAD